MVNLCPPSRSPGIGRPSGSPRRPGRRRRRAGPGAWPALSGLTLPPYWMTSACAAAVAAQSGATRCGGRRGRPGPAPAWRCGRCRSPRPARRRARCWASCSRGRRPPSPPVSCVSSTALGPVGLALFERLADAEDDLQPGGQGGVDLAVDERVGLAQLVPAFAVAEDDVLAADVDQHGRADLAGEGAFLLGVAVLAAQRDRAAVRAPGRRAPGTETADRRRPRRASRRRALDDRRRPAARRSAAVGVHLPVAGDEFLAHGSFATAASGMRLRKLASARLNQRLAHHLRQLAEVAPSASAYCSGNSACGPSDSAFSGQLWTSTWTPSAPAATAAQRHRRDQVGPAGRVAGIDDDRQVAQPLDVRHGAHVEHVARRVLEGAHAALAQDHVRVALGEDVLGRHQQVLDRRAHAALEQHRLAASGRLP